MFLYWPKVVQFDTTQSHLMNICELAQLQHPDKELWGHARSYSLQFHHRLTKEQEFGLQWNDVYIIKYQIQTCWKFLLYIYRKLKRQGLQTTEYSHYPKKTQTVYQDWCKSRIIDGPAQSWQSNLLSMAGVEIPSAL